MDNHPCCDCCAGIALDDHVGHGGSIEPNGHDLPCLACGEARLIREAKAEAWDNCNARWYGRRGLTADFENPYRD